uniref:Uncharacterized protein n=1 Tax=Anopheles darlingi TaxID=43151 RepID=A0A2M4D457_ANODA
MISLQMFILFVFFCLHTYNCIFIKYIFDCSYHCSVYAYVCVSVSVCLSLCGSGCPMIVSFGRSFIRCRSPRRSPLPKDAP